MTKDLFESADLALVRGSALTAFREVVDGLGGDAEALLRDAGLDPAAVGRHDRYLNHRGFTSVLENAAATTGTPDLGRRLGRLQGTDILGPVVPAARAARTVADAVAFFERFLPAYSTAASLRLHPLPDESLVLFEYRTAVHEPTPRPQVLELSLQVALSVFRLLLGPAFRPVAVHLPHQALSPRADYVRDYGATPLFGMGRAGFTLPAAVLARPLDHAPVTHQVLVQYLGSALLPDPAGHMRQATEFIRQMLPDGTVSIEAVADQLGLHPRALQRRLAAEGASFTDLVDAVRQATARELLTATDLSLSLVSRQLGYAEQSTLSRACRRWFGATPSAVRRSVRQERLTGTLPAPVGRQ
ncbi:AraC family transcriptional regulator [Streptomyces ipomoeae]|uniref:AraC family transcriptional regulator n=1 Tax=Streptomyces ipomoeae TaxID=103232 RepID=UPI0011461209|nr:AraC family transcriptional regulator [Streptomyces ipomoeae]MDX2935527.1 AraC family transcriptional regulator [Streptomyces ipomoeae]TQE18355.1 AraC family transcriptional regulator [Streptomyces ipomoeae]